MFHFLSWMKILHSAHFSMIKSLFSIQPLLPTMPQVTIQVYMACINNIYDPPQTGDRVHHVTIAFLLKRIWNWTECQCMVCVLHKFSFSYPLPLVASPTPVPSFSHSSLLVMLHVVIQGCGWSSLKWRMTVLRLHPLFVLNLSYEEPIWLVYMVGCFYPMILVILTHSWPFKPTMLISLLITMQMR